MERGREEMMPNGQRSHASQPDVTCTKLSYSANAFVVDDTSVPVCHHGTFAPSQLPTASQAQSTSDLQSSKLPRSNSAASYKPNLPYRWGIQGFNCYASTDSMD